MAKYSSKDVGLFAVHGYDVKGVTTTIDTTKISALTEDTLALGHDWAQHETTGLKRFDLTQQGFFDDAAASINAALSGKEGLVRIVVLAHAGNVIGRKFIGFEGPLVQDYTRLATLNMLHKANATYKGSGQVDEGVILQELEAKAADWNTEGADSVDSGASSADGGVGYLVVTAFSGFTGFVGKIRDSADDITYADLIEFDDVTDGPTAQRKTVAGTVEQYLAFDGNVTGSGSITVFAGFARG